MTSGSTQDIRLSILVFYSNYVAILYHFTKYCLILIIGNLYLRCIDYVDVARLYHKIRCERAGMMGMPDDEKDGIIYSQ